MVRFGGTTLPTILEVEDQYRKIYVERPIPGGALAKRKVRGTLGSEFRLRGLITRDERVKVLLHFNGANGATSTSDSSVYAHAVTLHNGAQLSTAQKKFGSASVLLDGVDDYVSIADSAEYVLGDKDFSLEIFYRLTQLPTSEYNIFNHMQNWSNFWEWQICNVGGGVYKYKNHMVVGGSTPFDRYSDPIPSLAIDTWYFTALSRQGNEWRLFHGTTGTTTKLDEWTSSVVLPDFNGPLRLGSLEGNYQFLNGFLDEFILITDFSRSSNFTVPDQEWAATISGQVALLKSLADGTARSLDLEDGSDPVTCLMLDPAFRETGKPQQALYEALFVQSS